MTSFTLKSPASAAIRHLVPALVLSSITIPAVADDNVTDAPQQVHVVGSAVPDYQVKTVSMGPLGQQSLLDTPYSIQVLPADLLEIQQLKSVTEAFRYLPSVQGENIRPQTRGLQAGVVQNTRVDGMNVAATTDYPVEQFERIDVLDGLAGALYGPANPAGTFNFELKRPTATPLHRVSVGYTTQSGKSASADLGAWFGPEQRFGYRVNLLDDSGTGYVDASHVTRKLASLAFDIRLAPGSTLQTNASRYRYTTTGLPGTFALANNVRFPSAPDPDRTGYGQPYAGDDNVTTSASARLLHRFNQDWQLSAGLLRQQSDRASTVPTNTLTSNAGAYTTTAATTTYSLDTILSNTIALNGRVHAGGWQHDLVLSNTGFDWKRFTPYQTGAITLGKATLDNPAVYAEPVFPDFKNRYRALTTRQQSYTVGDTLGLNERWSAALFASQSRIDATNYSKTGAVTSAYGDSGISSNATLRYKPRADMTLYGTYADSLQQGDIAPSGTLNAGTGLAPYRAKQWELGYKVGFGKIDASAALFRVERPYAVTGADNLYAAAGNQVNKGLELSAAGAVTSRLAVHAGFSWLDPRVYDTGSAATSGKQVLGLSRTVTSVLFDYSVAQVRGLALNLFVNHTGDMQGDNANTYQVDGHTVVDLGARYTSTMLGRNATLSLSVKNVADQRYWANITPSGQNGYSGAGNGTGTLGAPRTVRLALRVDL